MEKNKTRLERVTETVDELLMPGIDEILPVHRLTHELGADSLDFTEIIMAVEEEFDIEIDEDKLENTQDWTVQCIVDYLEKRLGPEFPPEGSCQIILKDEQQFIDRYKPETDEEGNLWVQREWDGGESEALIKEAIKEGRCWTMVECDGYWSIGWGNGVVNRLYNIITEKPIENQDWIVTVEDDDNQPEWGDDDEEE